MASSASQGLLTVVMIMCMMKRGIWTWIISTTWPIKKSPPPRLDDSVASEPGETTWPTKEGERLFRSDEGLISVLQAGMYRMGSALTCTGVLRPNAFDIKTQQRPRISWTGSIIIVVDNSGGRFCWSCLDISVSGSDHHPLKAHLRIGRLPEVR